MHSLFRALLEFLFPPRCCLCRRLGDHAVCPHCFQSILPDPRNLAAGRYEGALKKAILLFKFKNKRKLLPYLTILLADFLNRNRTAFRDAEAVVPVPLAKRRREQRGFNQAELLAEIAARYLSRPLLTEVLARDRETRPQFKLSRAARRENVGGAFRVTDPKPLRGKQILLVDDILTSGATVNECGRVLLKSGARSFRVLTLARAVGADDLQLR